MKKNIFFLLLLSVSNLFAQNYITSLPFNLKKGGKSFSYVDKSTDEVYLFISNSKKIKAVHYDNNFNSLDTLTTLIPNSKTNNMIGFTKNNTTANLVWMSNDNTKLCFQNLDFKNKTTTNSIKSISFENETFLQTYSTNDSFYCLSIINNSNILKIYVFNNKNELQVKTFDLSEKTFDNSNNEPATLYDLFSEDFDSYESAFELQNIDDSTPVSLTISAKKRKSYLSKNKLVLAFDNNTQLTQLVKIDLTNFTSSVEFIKNSSINTPTVTQSNSFVFENNLYQFKISDSKLFFFITDLMGTLIKQYETSINENIVYKNSDFLFQQVNSDEKNKIENTSQFLNTLGKYKIGISCYKYNDNTIISLGGVSKKIKKIDDSEDGSNSRYFFMQSGLIGAVFYAVFFNSFYDSYISSRNILSINTMFSKNFENQNEKVDTYATTKICSFFNGFSIIKCPTIFAVNGKAFIGHFNGEAKQFVIIKFEN